MDISIDFFIIQIYKSDEHFLFEQHGIYIDLCSNDKKIYEKNYSFFWINFGGAYVCTKPFIQI